MDISNNQKNHKHDRMIGIDLKFSPLAFLMKKEQYYGWIDKFTNELINSLKI